MNMNTHADEHILRQEASRSRIGPQTRASCTAEPLGSKHCGAVLSDGRATVQAGPSIRHPSPDLDSATNLRGRSIFPLLARFPVSAERAFLQTVHTLKRDTNAFNSLAMPVS
ncbi:MAG: hypothetical protein HQL99_00915 [Magnetococcales bacterium]|nr:hypothetical protein [Magnetococcales bacterium]